jgi:hypothetical protein
MQALIPARSNVSHGVMVRPYGSLLHSRFGALTAYPDCRRGGLGSVIDREPPGIWELPVDLDFVASVLEGDPIRSQGAFLDLTTGEVIYSSMIDYVAKDAAGTINVATEPDRWLFLPSLGSRAMLQHMAEFVAMITYRPLQDRMERAIEGLGAFHGFGDLISSEGLDADWHAFSDDRRITRAREFLADLGVRVPAS